jgi:hypothetical protein
MKTIVKEDIKYRIVKIISIVTYVNMVSINKYSMKYIMDADKIYGKKNNISFVIKEKIWSDPGILIENPVLIQ